MCLDMSDNRKDGKDGRSGGSAAERDGRDIFDTALDDYAIPLAVLATGVLGGRYLGKRIGRAKASGTIARGTKSYHPDLPENTRPDFAESAEGRAYMGRYQKRKEEASRAWNDTGDRSGNRWRNTRAGLIEADDLDQARSLRAFDERVGRRRGMAAGATVGLGGMIAASPERRRKK